jgi:hypothetical protein
MDLGFGISEHAIKKGLKELNSNIHFDMGGKLNLLHPNMAIWQGVFYNGAHLTSMDRDTNMPIPEYKTWTTKRIYKDHEWITVRDRLVRIGWRDTFENLIRYRVPGITRDSLAAKFNVPIKFFTGEKSVIEVAHAG